MFFKPKLLALLICFFVFSFLLNPISAHYTAPFLDVEPNKVLSDLYAFTSYETGREGFVTIIANFNSRSQSLGPQFNLFDSSALYEIHIDNDGDAIEDQTYRFEFDQDLDSTLNTVSVGGEEINIPFFSTGSFTTNEAENLDRNQTYSIRLIRNRASLRFGRGPDRPNSGKKLKNLDDDSKEFKVAEANVGSKTVADYDSYASGFVFDAKIPFKKCTESAKVFVGPRTESLRANLSGLYDGINYDPTVPAASQTDEYADRSVMSIALELPKSCLDLPNVNSVIGVWATVKAPARIINRANPKFGKPRLFATNDYVQVSRMGNPFVDEFLIGYSDKDDFETSRPRQDIKLFTKYFEFPALPSLIAAETSLTAPTLFPRSDLQELYLTGIPGLNQPSPPKRVGDVRVAEMLRLDTSTAPLVAASQSSLGFLDDDSAGYPNGRRPGDDVVDIFLRMIFGARLEVGQAADKDTELRDGVEVNAAQFADVFPYLNSP